MRVKGGTHIGVAAGVIALDGSIGVVVEFAAGVADPGVIEGVLSQRERPRGVYQDDQKKAE